jgi:hypothetical protein
MRRSAPLLALVVAFATLATQAHAAAPASTSAAAGSRISWHGAEWYLHGANVPWLSWACDFGCDDAGVANARTTATLQRRFAEANALGMHVIRWWTFEGDAWQIERDASGAPARVDPDVYRDFDAALRLAEANDLYYDFVLFSAPTALPGAWLRDAAQRDKLVAALTPLFARYRSNPRVLSWEVFNEPEWDIWNGKIAEAPVQETVRAIARAVHASSGAYVTVGSAMLDGLPLWLDAGLDYYQAHWYDYMSRGDYCAICTNYDGVKARYGLQAPLVIGELYVGRDTPGRLDIFYDEGYAGAWPWSLFPDSTNDRIEIDAAQAAAFASRHSDFGPRATSTKASASPVSTPATAASATPTAQARESAPAPSPTAQSTPLPAAPSPGAAPEPSVLDRLATIVSSAFGAIGDAVARLFRFVGGALGG